MAWRRDRLTADWLFAHLDVVWKLRRMARSLLHSQREGEQPSPA